jgi:hypothetical protein
VEKCTWEVCIPKEAHQILGAKTRLRVPRLCDDASRTRLLRLCIPSALHRSSCRCASGTQPTRRKFRSSWTRTMLLFATPQSRGNRLQSINVLATLKCFGRHGTTPVQRACKAWRNDSCQPHCMVTTSIGFRQSAVELRAGPNAARNRSHNSYCEPSPRNKPAATKPKLKTCVPSWPPTSIIETWLWGP